jgi:hypothetical protein
LQVDWVPWLVPGASPSSGEGEQAAAHATATTRLDSATTMDERGIGNLSSADVT